MPPLALQLIVLCAFVVEATAGFGATVVTVTLAAHLLPIEEVLAIFVPVNVLMSLYLSLRYRAQIDWRVLSRKVLPFMGLGLACGMALFHRRGHGGHLLKAGFAAFVLLLSLVELARMGAQQAGAQPLPRWRAIGALLGAGLVHGVFACGGPLAVYVLSREVTDKGRFRATLSSLWLSLNGVLLLGYAYGGTLTAGTLAKSALLLPALLGGLLAGEWLHRRLPARYFRRGVYVLLLLSAASLLIRSL